MNGLGEAGQFAVSPKPGGRAASAYAKAQPSREQPTFPSSVPLQCFTLEGNLQTAGWMVKGL